MKTIKDAADSLIKKGEITQKEYDALEKSGAFELTKEGAIPPPFLARLSKKLGNAYKLYKPLLAGTAIGGAGILAGKELVYDPMKRTLDTKKSFEEITKMTPQLREKDPEEIKEYFNVVKTFSPKAASNPLVAGALVNKMMEFGGVDHKLVQDISSIESGVVKPSIVQTATEAAAKSISPIPDVKK